MSQFRIWHVVARGDHAEFSFPSAMAPVSVTASHAPPVRVPKQRTKVRLLGSRGIATVAHEGNYTSLF